ncbi:MAG: hypothetical protein ACE5FG_13490 [Myxococcota bacterium]
MRVTGIAERPTLLSTARVERVWSAQSEALDSVTVEARIESVTRTVVDCLGKEGLIP